MAKPSIFTHPKFQRLVRLLQMPEAHVLGHLEYLWHVGYQDGNPLIGDTEDVEAAAKWVGKPGAFTSACVTVKLLDKVRGGRFQIHDLLGNAPDYVKSRDRMRKQRKSPENVWNSSEQLRNGCALPSHPTVPTPSHPTVPTPSNPDPSDSGTPDLAAQVVEAWNATTGTRPVRSVTGARAKSLKARLSEPSWVRDFREALAKFPLKCFVGEGDDHYVPDLDFFLRPDSVTRILEGKYDWSKDAKSGKGRGKPIDPKQIGIW